MDLEAAANEAFELLDDHFAEQPPPERTGLIVQYVSVAPSPKNPRWIQVAFSVDRRKDDPETVAAARGAMQALVDQKGWSLVNEEPDFNAAPRETAADRVSVTWWIHED